MVKKLGFLFVVSTFSARAQVPVSIGMTQQQVRAALGRPLLHKNLVETYLRKSFGEEFEIQVAYYFDDSVSKLHPSMRVSSLSFSPDKRRPWSTLASAIPELRQLCANGCDTVAAFAKDGVRPDDLGTFVMGCPSRSAEQSQHADKWWESRINPELCFEVSFVLPEKSLESDLDWPSLEVRDIEIRSQTPSAPDGKGLPSYVSIRSLGRWPER